MLIGFPTADENLQFAVVFFMIYKYSNGTKYLG